MIRVDPEAPLEQLHQAWDLCRTLALRPGWRGWDPELECAWQVQEGALRWRVRASTMLPWYRARFGQLEHLRVEIAPDSPQRRLPFLQQTTWFARLRDRLGPRYQERRAKTPHESVLFLPLRNLAEAARESERLWEAVMGRRRVPGRTLPRRGKRPFLDPMVSPRGIWAVREVGLQTELKMPAGWQAGAVVLLEDSARGPAFCRFLVGPKVPGTPGKIPTWPWLTTLAAQLQALRFPRRTSHLGVAFERRGMALEHVLPAVTAIDEALGFAEASREAWALPKPKAARSRSRLD